MKGLILACRYSWNCHTAIHFGISERLFDFITGKKKDPEKIKKLLKILSSYKSYCNIATASRIDDPFDIRVISYYWKGTGYELDTKIWHNYTTLSPLFNMPMEIINANMVDEDFVHPAEIIRTDGEKTIIKYYPVIKHKKGLALLEKRKEKNVANPFTEKYQPGDKIAMHFESIVEILDENEFKILSVITRESLKRFNEKHKRGRK